MAVRVILVLVALGAAVMDHQALDVAEWARIALRATGAPA